MPLSLRSARKIAVSSSKYIAKRSLGLNLFYALLAIVALVAILRVLMWRYSDDDNKDGDQTAQCTYSLDRDIQVRFNYKVSINACESPDWNSFLGTYYTILNCDEFAKHSGDGLHWVNNFSPIKEYLTESEGSLCGEIWDVEWNSEIITSTVGYDKEEKYCMSKTLFFEMYEMVIQIQNKFDEFFKTAQSDLIKFLQDFTPAVTIWFGIAVDPTTAKLLSKSHQISDPLNEIEVGSLKWFDNLELPKSVNGVGFNYFLDSGGYDHFRQININLSDLGIQRKWCRLISSSKIYAVDFRHIPCLGSDVWLE